MHMVYISPVCKCVVEGAQVEGHVEELLSRLLLVQIMHMNC